MKRLCFLVAPIFSTLVAFMIAGLAPAFAITTSGPITGSETWSGYVYLTGDVTVTSTGNLTILPGTRIESDVRADDQIAGIHTSRIELICDQGTLNASGTEVQPIVFSVATSTPLKGDWYGIRINSSNVTLRYCVVEYGKEGLRIEGGSPLVEYSTFTMNEIRGVRFDVGGNMDHCSLTYNGEGAWVRPNHTAQFTGCSIRDNLGRGIGSDLGSSTITATACVVRNNGSAGIQAPGGYAIVTAGTTVVDNSECGIDVGPWGSATVEDSNASANYYGISVGQGTGVIRRSRVEDNRGDGLYVNWNGGGTVTVEDCVIQRNQGCGIGPLAYGGAGVVSIARTVIADNGSYGIYTSTLSLTDSTIANNAGVGIAFSVCGVSGIGGNLIYRNQTGVIVSCSDPRLDLSSGNDIFDNIQYELKNAGTAAVVADGDYWGEPTTTQLAQIPRPNLTKIYDSRDDPNVGQVVIHNWSTTAYHSATSIAQIKARPDGVPVIHNSAIVSEAWPDYFYIETQDRSCGIRVDGQGTELTLPTRVDVTGILRTNPDGERYIDTGGATPHASTDSAEPLFLINSRLGGGDWMYSLSSGAGQKGVKGGAGLNSIGLLVNTMGRVTFADTGNGYFCLDDGSALDDGSGHLGVKTLGTVPVEEGQDPVGKYVKVTGISSCYQSGSDLFRLIRSTQVSIIPE